MKTLNPKKVVLAYSGGLDTSIILKWLIEQGFQVIAFIADLGGAEDFEAAKQKALGIGATKVYIEDLKEEFVTDYIFPTFKGGAIYEGRYLLGTALARPLIAKKQVEIAEKEGAQWVSHGATGKGNDQVRFELAYYALNPKIKVLAPWKMPEFLNHFTGRSDLITYAKKHHIPVSSTINKSYSEDDNLLHISHEAGDLEDPGVMAPMSVYSKTLSPQQAADQTTTISIEFKDGIPIKVENHETGAKFETPLELFCHLNQVGAQNAIGRIDIVENRFVGIKSRGIYETPGGTILHIAQRDIEGIAMDREVMRLRDMLCAKFAELIYNGFWFSPEKEFLMAAIDKSAEYIDGVVTMELYKGNVIIQSRKSPSSLYDQDLSSMDKEGGFNQQDSEGFIRINAIRLMAHGTILKKRQLNGVSAK